MNIVALLIKRGANLTIKANVNIILPSLSITFISNSKYIMLFTFLSVTQKKTLLTAAVTQLLEIESLQLLLDQGLDIEEIDLVRNFF